MDLVSLPLDALHAHPANANVMPPELLDKLVAHLRDTDRYPPIIVRPIPGAEPLAASHEPPGKYQILDGHHRAIALRRLARTHARCVVWDVDE